MNKQNPGLKTKSKGHNLHMRWTMKPSFTNRAIGVNVGVTGQN